MRSLIALVFVLAMTPAAIAQQLSGTLFDSGKFWNIRDAIAVRSERGIEIYLTEGYFDRFAYAADGKIESRDLRLHSHARIQFDLKPDGSYRYLYSPGYAEEEEDRNPIGGWQLITLSENHLKARWRYGQSDFNIDVPIEGSTEVLLGTQAKSDSAPAKALLAYLAARAKGDGKAALLLCRLPEELAQMTPAKRAEFIQSVSDTRPFATTNVVLQDVRILGATADVRFSGKRLAGKPSTRAFMVKIDDQWLVQGMGE